MKSTEKKQTYFLRAAMMVLTTILIVLFFIIISLVSKIQGTARVINYAGLVRGGTQLMVKLEISQEPQDEKYREISDYIEGLRYGSEELNLICLEDKNFQNKMDELACYFEEVRSELLLVRERTPESKRRKQMAQANPKIVLEEKRMDLANVCPTKSGKIVEDLLQVLRIFFSPASFIC